MNNPTYPQFYYGLLSFGGICAVLGFVIIVLVLKFVRGNRVKHSITGMIFMLGGVGVFIFSWLAPSPSTVNNQTTEMLKLDSLSLTTISIYEKSQTQPITEISDGQQLAEWANILNSCQAFSPNHPRYKKLLYIVLQSKDNEFVYEVGLDAKHPNTADITLLQTDRFRDGYYNFGSYRCNGLFEFISALNSDL